MKPTSLNVQQSAPLYAGEPKLIATIPYTSFAANTTIYPYYKGVLTRNARSRTYAVYNTMDQQLSAGFEFNPYDSTAAAEPPGIQGGFTWGSGVAQDQFAIVSSELGSSGGAGILAAAVDSFQGGYAMGATAPTSGNLYVYINEKF